METGDFCWHELMTTDLPAAAVFYADVTGWAVRDSGMPGMTYLLGLIGDRQVAGLMGTPPDAAAAGAKPAWYGYVAVEDVDAMAQRATEAGGAVHHGPMDIPGIGRFAMAADPQGAMFALFKGDGEAAADLPMETPGWPSWHELHTRDPAAAADFYTALFGWTKGDALDMGPAGAYQLFATSGADMVGGMMKNAAPHSYWLHYFSVDGIDGAIARVTAGGGTILNGPMEVPGGAWVAQALDPQGAAFALVGQRG